MTLHLQETPGIGQGKMIIHRYFGIKTDDDKPMIIKKSGKKPIISMVDTAAEIEQMDFESIAPNLMPFPRKI